jgi:uncharacterized protein (DUF1330 family)
MKTYYTVALSMLAGIGVGVVAVQTLHAQATPPIYRISEIEITDVDAYTKEFAPKAQAVLKAAGGRFLAAGQKVTALEGEPPKTRVTIQVWESLDKMKGRLCFGGIQGSPQDRRQVREIPGFRRRRPAPIAHAIEPALAGRRGVPRLGEFWWAEIESSQLSPRGCEFILLASREGPCPADSQMGSRDEPRPSLAPAITTSCRE